MILEFVPARCSDNSDQCYEGFYIIFALKKKMSVCVCVCVYGYFLHFIPVTIKFFIIC